MLKIFQINKQILFYFTVITLFIRPAAASEGFTVFVSILPQKYFVEKIGKSQVDVRVMVHPGANPATYEPKPRQMAALAKAKLYFAVGVPFEHVWLKKIAADNPEMNIIHTDEGIEKISMTDHHHDKKDIHGHKSKDPHIWLSPALVKIQAYSIFTALKTVDPDHGMLYKTNYDRFIADIDALDQELKNGFSDIQNRRFMVFHPSWGYFAQAYGLTQIPVEMEGKEPKPGQLKELIEYARTQQIRIIFAQPQFSTKSARLVAGEIGGTVTFADPLAEDWPANLRKTAAALKAAMK